MTEDRQAGIIFGSPDSAHHGLSRSVPPVRLPLLLATFITLSIASLWTINHYSLKQYFPQGDLFFPEIYAGSKVLAIRLFLLCFFVSFSLSIPFGLKRRVVFCIHLILFALAGFACMDVIAILLRQAQGIVLSATFAGLFSGLIGLAVFSQKILEFGEMPEGVPVEWSASGIFIPLAAICTFFFASFAISRVVELAFLLQIEQLRQVALLGGIGPGIFLVIPLMFTFLFFYGKFRNFLLSVGDFYPDLTIIIPAHNESYIIHKTISAIDTAASRYCGNIRFIVLDNNSTDSTIDCAQGAISACIHATGSIISVPEPGKASALNRGLAETSTEFLVRIDADTQVHPDVFRKAMPYFKNEQVGVVGGLPVPPGGGPFDKARYIEVLVKHGFYSIGLSAVNGLVGVPGMFCVYRTDDLRRIGGFVGSMNGEDTDCSLRVGEIGRQAVIDCRITYVSEVPVTYWHLREQRLRWYRSVFHVSARSREVILGRRFSIRGKITLPYMLVNSARRATLIPLFLFGLIEYMLPFGISNLNSIQPVLALYLGSSLILTVCAILFNGRFRALLWIPHYILFRILRSWFTLESMMTVVLRKRPKSFEPALAIGDFKALIWKHRTASHQFPAPPALAERRTRKPA